MRQGVRCGSSSRALALVMRVVLSAFCAVATACGGGGGGASTPDGGAPTDGADGALGGDQLGPGVDVTGGSGTVGAAGGTVTSADGSVTLTFPAGALAVETLVSVSTRAPTAAEAGELLAGNVIDIDLEPAPLEPLDPPALLALTAAPAGPVRFARFAARAGAALADAPASPAPGRFVPLAHTRADAAGRPSVALARFSTYAAVAAAPADCVPSAEQLQPPVPPAGYEYVGTEVVVDQVLVEGLSTVPADRPQSATDLVQLSAATTVSAGGVDCDVVVAHILQPAATPAECPVPPELLVPPPTPDGYVYVGYDVVVNFRYAAGTVPPTLVEPAGSIHAVRSRTESADGVVTCDVIVQHLFVPDSDCPAPCPKNHVCIAGECVCRPTCADDPKPCDSDGCGGSCGTCAANETCMDGICQCFPDCVLKSCGPDGCGGSCGACAADWNCVGNHCERGGACTPAAATFQGGSCTWCSQIVVDRDDCACQTTNTRQISGAALLITRRSPGDVQISPEIPWVFHETEPPGLVDASGYAIRPAPLNEPIVVILKDGPGVPTFQARVTLTVTEEGVSDVSVVCID